VLPDTEVAAHPLGTLNLKEGAAMTNDDLLYRHHLLFAKVTELGVNRACQEVGYPPPFLVITARNRWSSAMGSRCCARASVDRRGCPTSSQIG
jgi:hypothetical protein